MNTSERLASQNSLQKTCMSSKRDGNYGDINSQAPSWTRGRCSSCCRNLRNLRRWILLSLTIPCTSSPHAGRGDFRSHRHPSATTEITSSPSASSRSGWVDLPKMPESMSSHSPLVHGCSAKVTALPESLRTIRGSTETGHRRATSHPVMSCGPKSPCWPKALADP